MGLILKHVAIDAIVKWIKQHNDTVTADPADASTREQLLEICKWEIKSYDWRYKRGTDYWCRVTYRDIMAEVIKGCALFSDSQLLHEAVKSCAKYDRPAGQNIYEAVVETLSYLPFNDVKPWCVHKVEIFGTLA